MVCAQQNKQYASNIMRCLVVSAIVCFVTDKYLAGLINEQEFEETTFVCFVGVCLNTLFGAIFVNDRLAFTKSINNDIAFIKNATNSLIHVSMTLKVIKVMTLKVIDKNSS